MFFDVAHIIGDGITMNILMEDLKKIYDGENVNKETFTFYEYILDHEADQNAGGRERDVAAVADLMKGNRLTRTSLLRHDRQDCSKGVYNVIRRRLDRIVRKEVLYYCKMNNVSENALFLAAFNYTLALFSNEDDVFVNSIHSGRTDGRFAGVAGCIFKTYLCRYQRVAHEKVNDLITKTGKQIMNTMKVRTSVSRMGDMFLQYQGDILTVPTPGDTPGERMRCIQLDSLPFHMQIMYDDEGFYTELRYWENRFDGKLLEIFLTCYEEICRAVMKEPSVRRLKYHVPERVYPKHFRVKTDKLNEEAVTPIFTKLDHDRWVKVYVLDESYRKKPYGAWGPLYVMDYTPDYFEEVVENPYGPGTLYKTGQIARILPDGTVDFMEVVGREIMTDGARGRRFFDLNVTRDALLAYDGIIEADAYMSYNPAVSEYSVFADVKAEEGFDKEACIAYLKEKIAEVNLPQDIFVV
jgi:hypothetical protein